MRWCVVSIAWRCVAVVWTKSGGKSSCDFINVFTVSQLVDTIFVEYQAHGQRGPPRCVGKRHRARVKSYRTQKRLIVRVSYVIQWRVHHVEYQEVDKKLGRLYTYSTPPVYLKKADNQCAQLDIGVCTRCVEQTLGLLQIFDIHVCFS